MAGYYLHTQQYILNLTKQLSFVGSVEGGALASTFEYSSTATFMTLRDSASFSIVNLNIKYSGDFSSSGTSNVEMILSNCTVIHVAGFFSV
jgi:hypothetical protein